MSRRRKHLDHDRREGIALLAGEDIHVCQVDTLRGGKEVEVHDTQGRSFFAAIPSRFWKRVWLKKGNFVVVEGVSEEQLAALQEEAGALKRQLGEIRDILQESDVRELQKLGKWPEEFRLEKRRLSSRPANVGDSSDSEEEPTGSVRKRSQRSREEMLDRWKSGIMSSSSSSSDSDEHGVRNRSRSSSSGSDEYSYDMRTITQALAQSSGTFLGEDQKEKGPGECSGTGFKT